MRIRSVLTTVATCRPTLVSICPLAIYLSIFYKLYSIPTLVSTNKYYPWVLSCLPKSVTVQNRDQRSVAICPVLNLYAYNLRTGMHLASPKSRCAVYTQLGEVLRQKVSKMLNIFHNSISYSIPLVGTPNKRLLILMRWAQQVTASQVQYQT